MRLTPNEDQATFFAVLEQMMRAQEVGWKVSPDWARFDWSAGLDARLEQNGFYDCAAEEALGLVTAAHMTCRLASLPVAAECAASSMLRPLYCPALPRPLAVIETDETHAIRFLPVARSVILLGADGIRAATLSANAVEPVESLFAYPMGALATRELDWKPIDADPEAVRDTWRVAVAAEIVGALKGGLDAVVAHVRQRHQFGRPLGSFQAIQHRLAGAAAKIEGAYWLTLRAASACSGEVGTGSPARTCATQSIGGADAATALGYAQEISTKVVYDLHQFMGATGLTLEHPLHRWTYRVRLLRSSLGGASANLTAVSTKRWRAA